tara:strand:- start:20775 stop:21032 length:258 start_codon:yes stop_codon:yes gene_type:complete
MAIKLKRDRESLQPKKGRKLGEYAEAITAEFRDMRRGESFTLKVDGASEMWAVRQVLHRLKRSKVIRNYRTNFDPINNKLRVWKA